MPDSTHHIWLRGMKCNGTEASIDECHLPNWGSPGLLECEAPVRLICYEQGEQVSIFTLLLYSMNVLYTILIDAGWQKLYPVSSISRIRSGRGRRTQRRSRSSRSRWKIPGRGMYSNSQFRLVRWIRTIRISRKRGCQNADLGSKDSIACPSDVLVPY